MADISHSSFAQYVQHLGFDFTPVYFYHPVHDSQVVQGKRSHVPEPAKLLLTTLVHKEPREIRVERDVHILAKEIARYSKLRGIYVGFDERVYVRFDDRPSIGVGFLCDGKIRGTSPKLEYGQ
jgi:hypothetical protein